MSYEEEDTCQSILVSLACLAWTQPSRFVQQGSRRGIFFCLIFFNFSIEQSSRFAQQAWNGRALSDFFFNFLLSSHRASRSRRGMAVP
jgi:hypothetical protein